MTEADHGSARPHPLRRALDALYLFAGYAAGAFLVMIFAIMMVMSVGRQFSLNIPAGDDIASWCMAAMAFLGLAHNHCCKQPPRFRPRR